MTRFSTFLFLRIAAVTVLAASCSRTPASKPESTRAEGRRPQAAETRPSAGPEQEPPPIWTVPEGPVRTRPPRDWDLIRQQITLRFRFRERQVVGRTVLYFKPVNPTAPIVIDAKDMAIRRLVTNPPALLRTFEYDSTKIRVHLSGRRLRPGDSLAVEIEYTATPPYQTGLHFTDPDGVDDEVPTQVWTLGQPEDNSYWLPTVDRPDEKLRHELWLSLPDSMFSFSNGTRLYARKTPGDSLTTHYWTFEQEHSTYLLGFAAGLFTQRRSMHNTLPLVYAVDFAYDGRVLDIFSKTGPAIDFLTAQFGVPFPWSSYTQVAVHEFPAAGMENTGCALLFDGIQTDARAALDIENQDLIVHEIAHQWIGNLTTATDWHAVAIQEGLATFLEYRFRETTSGQTAADYQRLLHRDEYYDQADYVRHPLIWRNYEDPYDLFDAHSYNKGGQIFHMLHRLVGDAAFKAALNALMVQYRGATYDDMDVQRVFESASGKNLSWFFDQWLRKPGHPQVQAALVDRNGVQELHLKQVHDRARQPRFVLQLPVELVLASGERRTLDLHWTGKDTVINLTALGGVVDVIADPKRHNLAEYSEIGMDLEQLAFRLQHPEPLVRFELLREVERGRVQLPWADILRIAKADPVWQNRESAWAILGVEEEGRKLLAPLAYNMNPATEKEGRVRIRAVMLLAELDGSQADAKLREFLDDPSYFVASEAVMYYGQRHPEAVVSSLKRYSEPGGYDDVMRIAYVRALGYSNEPTAQQELEAIALRPTARPYTVEAVRILAERAVKPERAAERTAASTILRKAGASVYFEKRVEAYRALQLVDGPAARTFFLRARDKAVIPEERMLLDQLLNPDSQQEN